MRKAVGIALGCGGLLTVAVMSAAILGFFVYRNMNPKPSEREVPASVGKFKLEKMIRSNGNVFGTRTSFQADYAMSEGTRKRILSYMTNSFASDIEAMELIDRLPCANPAKTGMVRDTRANEIGIFKICLAGGNYLMMSNQERTFVLVSDSVGSMVSVAEMLMFIKQVPFNSELDLASFGAEFALAESVQNNVAANVVPAFELAKKHAASKESVRPYQGREITVRGYIESAPAVTKKTGGGFAKLGERAELVEGTVKFVTCRFEAEDARAFAALKSERYVTVRGIFDGRRNAELKFCKVVRAE